MLSCSAGFKVFLIVLACGMLVGLAAVAPAPPEYVASTVIWEQRPPSIAETSTSGSKPNPSRLSAERSGDAEPADPAMANRHGIASPADGDPRQTITSANLLLAVLEREDVAAQLDGKLASEALERLRQRLEVTTTAREGNGRRIVVRYHDRTAERALVLCRAITETYVAEARNAFARMGTLTPVEAEQRAAKAKQRVEAIQAEIDRLLRDALTHDDATRQEPADRPSASQSSEDTRATGAHWPRSERRSPWSAYEDVYGSRYVPPETGSTPAPDSDYEFGRAVHGQAVEIPPTVPGAPSQPPIGTTPRGPSHHDGEVARPGASQLQGRSRAPAPRPHDGRRAGDGRSSEPSRSVADRLRALKQERARLLETLTPAHPKVKYLDQWIKDLENLRDSDKRLPSGNADFQTRESTIGQSDEHSREHTSSPSPSSSRNVPDSSNDQHRSEQQAPWLRLPPVDAKPTESAGESEPGKIEQPEPGASVRENAPVLPGLPAGGGPQPDGRQRPSPPADHQRQPMSADSAVGPALGGSTSQAEKEAFPLDRPSAEEEQSASESGTEVKARSLPQDRLAEYKRLREQLREAIESHERWLAAEIKARQLQTLQGNATVEIVSPARIVAERNLRVLPHRLFRAVLFAIGVAAAAAGLTRWKRRKLLDAADAGESLGLPVLLLSGNDELVLQPTKRRASWSYRLAVGATFVVAASTIFLIARDSALRQEFRDRPLTATARAVDRILPL